MSGQPNWFFALPVDGRFMERLAPPPDGFRAFSPADVHVTVAYLGACGEQRAVAAGALLADLLAREARAPIPFTIGAIVPMGSPRRYTALSALLVRGREETAALIGALRDPLADAAHAARDARPPKPHLTVARPARRATDRARAEGLAWARRQDLTGASGTFDAVALYTWSDDRRERLFRIVATWRLGDAATGLRSPCL